MKRIAAVLVPLLVAGFRAGPARAQTAQPETDTIAVPKPTALDSLRLRVAALERALSSRRAAGSADALPPSMFDNGFTFVGADDELRLGGWAQIDGRALTPDTAGINTVGLRRVRLYGTGRLEHVFGYRIEIRLDDGRAALQEVWAEFAQHRGLRVRGGQFKEPFSREALASSKYIDFVDGSAAVSGLAPAEDIGLLIYGAGPGSRLEYGVGAFDGRGKNLTDNNDAKEVAARLMVQPITGLYIGGSASSGRVDEARSGDAYRASGRSAFAVWGAGVAQAGRRTRLGADLELFGGPASLKAEWIALRDRGVARSGATSAVVADGGYVAATWLVTGEQKSRNRAQEVKRPVGESGGSLGAWEVGARLERMTLNRNAFSAGILLGAPRLDAATLGVNAYLNRHITVAVNATRSWYAPAIGSSGLVPERRTWDWLVRTQFDF